MCTMPESAPDPTTDSFSTWRRILWPVHRHELRKLLPILFLFFLVTFNYNVLRIMKDTLVVTAKMSGAEIIPFIKVWAMFPSAVVVTALFSFLSNRYSKETVFYALVAIFAGYFALFLVLLPVQEHLQPGTSADWLARVLPSGFAGLIAMYRYWLFTLFYVMSELWGSVIHGTLLWGFANQVTRLHEAKRFYGLYVVGANVSGVVAGQVSIALCSNPFYPWLPYGTTAWDQSILFILLSVLAAAGIAIGLFRWTVNHVLTDPRYYDLRDAHDEREAQGKISLMDNFSYLLRSRYLMYIAVIVLGYNIVINLTEVVWKHEVKLLYPNPQHYNLYMNQVSSILGVLATLSALLVAGNAIRVLGWTRTALLTPLLLFLTSLGFFGPFLLPTAMLGGLSGGLSGSQTVLPLIVFFGTLQNCLARTAKYTVFDATKEMAFVPLPADMKINGKAAIDGVGSRLGKSGGSVIHQGLLLLCGTLSASAPWVGLFIVITLLGWMWAVRALGAEFAARSQAQR